MPGVKTPPEAPMLLVAADEVITDEEVRDYGGGHKIAISFSHSIL
jgi:hypothetical protein